MELRVLKYFLMIAREENITRAAQLLHVTQPTLSRQIKELEEELGTKLFERSNHRIILTQDGLLLRRRAQEIVELTERTEKDFAHKDEELTGEIAIGSGETRSVSVLAEVLSSFRQRYPRVRYRFYSGNADHIKERIENGTLDIGLFPEPVDISRYEFIRVPEEASGCLPCGQRSDCARKEMPIRHFGTYRIGIRHGSGSCDTMGMSSKGHPFFRRLGRPKPSGHLNRCNTQGGKVAAKAYA